MLFLAGVFVRLLLPAALTLGVAWLLHRLDVRWQAAAAAAAPRRSVGAQPPCWETHQCSPERRAVCPAYGQHAVACWQFFRDARGNLHADCLTCEVFQQAPAPLAG
jgi:hypothetical protein